MDRMHGWVGRKDRRPIAVDALIRRADGSELQAKLTDISDEGCRIECSDEVLRIGEWVELAVSSAPPVKAQVRWALGHSAGVKFEVADE
jgi:PilZ domain